MKPPPGYFVRNAPRILARIAGSYLWSYARLSPSEKKVLIVKPDALGDQVLFSGILPAMRRAFEGYEITILVQESVAPFYEVCPHIDRIFVLDRGHFFRNVLYAFHRIREIRRERFSATLHLSFSRDTAGDQISIASGAPRIVGMEGDTANQPAFLKKFHDRRYTELVPERSPKPIFEGYRYLSVPEHLGSPMEEEWRPMAWVRNGDREKALGILKDLGLSRTGYIIIAPGAGEKIRQWPPEKFAAVCDRLHAEKGADIVLVGAPGEKTLTQTVRSRMQSPAYSAVGATTVSVLLALIERSSLVIGNESGPIHFAMAVGTPAVAVMGGGHYGRFLPYPGDWPLRCVTHREECFGCNWVCPRAEATCISRVAPDEVFEAAASLLERTWEESHGPR